MDVESSNSDIDGSHFISWWGRKDKDELGVASWSVSPTNKEEIKYIVTCNRCNKQFSVTPVNNPRGLSYSHKFFTPDRHSCIILNNNVNDPIKAGVNLEPVQKKRKLAAEMNGSAYEVQLIDRGTLLKSWWSNGEHSKEELVYKVCSAYEEFGITYDFASVNEARKELNSKVLHIFLTCHYCHKNLSNKAQRFWFDATINKNIIDSVMQHLGYNLKSGGLHANYAHKVCQSQSRLTQYMSIKKSLSISDFAEEFQGVAKLCFGYRPDMNDALQYSVWKYHPDIPENSTYYKIDGTTVLKLKDKPDPIQLVGGYRHKDCMMVSCFTDNPLPNFCCTSCGLIANCREYQRQLMKRENDINSSSIIAKRPLKFEFQDNKVKRMKLLSESVNKYKLLVLDLCRKNQALKQKPTDIIQRLERDAPLKDIVKNLLAARESQVLTDNSIIFKYMEDTSRNILRKKGGQRWSQQCKIMMAGSKIKGGRRNLNHMSNLIPMSEKTATTFIKKEKMEFTGGFSKEALRSNLLVVRDLILLQRQLNKIPRETRIAGLITGDETPILQRILVALEKIVAEGSNIFEVSGFCGCKYNSESGCKFGECSETKTITYVEDLKKCYNTLRRAGSVSILILSTFHEDLPDFPFGLAATCGKFTDDNYRELFEDVIVPIYKETVGIALNYPYPLGLHSDGDSRRSSYMYRTMDPFLESTGSRNLREDLLLFDERRMTNELIPNKICNKHYQIKSLESDELYDIRCLNSTLSNHLTSKLNRDRQRRIAEAAKVSKIESYLDISSASQSFGPGVFCFFWFPDTDPGQGLRLWLGEIVIVTKLSGSKWVPYTKPLLIGSFPSASINVECVWYKPKPQEGETIYNATVYTICDSAAEHRLHSGPCSADRILSCPDIFRLKGSTADFRVNKISLLNGLELLNAITISLPAGNENLYSGEDTEDI
jgi:hypothetical protein